MIYLRIYAGISFFLFWRLNLKFHYNFPAVRGLQAEREYYIAMIPLALLPKMFGNEDEYLLPEYRAQRNINESRIPEIRDYILNNPTTYCFSALSASIDGDFSFEKSELDENIGVLKVDMSAVLLINDGQHRKAAIEAALKEKSKLSDETIAIVLFKDEGLKRSQQMFADLNKHAVKPSKSLSTLYDDRDDLSNAVKEVVNSISFLNKYIDKEHDSLGKYSSKLYTLSNFLRANQRIVRNSVIYERDREFLLNYWKAVFSNIEELKMLENKQIYKCTLKEEYILTLSVLINAFGRLGYTFYVEKLDFSLLKNLSTIDWLRNNPEWIGRVFNEQGKINGKEDGVIKICNLIKTKLGIKLNKEETVKENEIRR